MNTIKKILQESNLGFIEGKFASNYSLSDLKIKRGESYKNEWSGTGGTTGYPSYLKVVFEYQGVVIFAIKKRMTPGLMSKLVTTEKSLTFPIDWFEVNVEVLFDERVNMNIEATLVGTFYAALHENELDKHLNKFFSQKSKNKK